MSLLQDEYRSHRAAGLRAGAALSAMILWRADAVAMLLSSAPVVPASIMALVSELREEMTRLRMTRRVAGVRP